MAHRYATRSESQSLVIDLTKTPRAPKSRRQFKRAPATGASHSPERTIGEEMIVEIRDDPIENSELEDVRNRASILPCLNNSFNGTPEIITCSICFEALSARTEPRATHCGHIFCASCLAMSLEKSKCCPTCQTVTEFSTSIRIYF